MIFDEATSSVDAESERLIMRTVHELAERKTVILVTHRLADAVDASAIAVFDHGACVETGTHAELMAEATSSVDAESERLIMRTVHELAERKTVILVTHRLADAVDASAIAVFDHGACVETGTHAELMAQGGQYATMFRAQASVEQVGRRARNRGIAYAPAPNTVEHNVKQPESANTQRALMTTFQLVRRLLGQVGDLRPLMVLACCFGTLGHLAATFLPVFGVMALCAAAGRPVWGLSVGWAVALMVVCALIRGAMRYCEQYMNHNLAFRLLALFRGQMFAALRRLAPAKLTGKGKGDLISMVTTDVELLEIFFAHTISPTVIALATTVVYAIALLFLSPWFAVLLVVAHLLLGVVVPAWFAWALHGVGMRIRKQSASLDDDVLDDMRGLEQIIRFGQGRARLARIDRQSRALWGQRVELSARNGVFGGFDHVIIVLVTVCAAAGHYGCVCHRAAVPEPVVRGVACGGASAPWCGRAGVVRVGVARGRHAHPQAECKP